MWNWRALLLKKPELAGLPAGAAGERWAEYLYRLKGCRVLERNYAVFSPKQLGELDLIFKKGKDLIFVEVKTRRDENFMQIFETVNWKKQSLLRRMARLYIESRPQYHNHNIQIDIVGILMNPFDNSVNSVRILENAIEGD